MSERAETIPPRPTVLVTGAAGFIGSHLVDALVARGLSVRALDNLAAGRRENLNPRAEFVAGDIRRPESIRAAFAGVDCVFHTAALPRVMLSIDDPRATHLTNVDGTLNVLIEARDAGVRKVIYSGSSSVYGEQPVMPLVESMTPNPLNPYALQKLVGEQYCRMFYRLFGLQSVALRYFNVYGPRMATEGAYVTVLSVFMRARREGRPLPIHGDGEQTRDFTHVRDVVRANLAAMDSTVGDGRALNVGSGRGISVNRIATLFGGQTIHLPPRPAECAHTLADLTEVKRVLGWEPQVASETGIRELIETTARS
ncbi:MAG TPA: NAD-dependent epimerase/dehydratase family protein [Candidatus Binataceae bacterium]|nr:NAD-dependent epimerase/dehydratase family protein [Candidatus Binataceae bacterium]